jgi:hypothetical protein
MKISDSKLTRVYFNEKFYTLYELKEDVPIVLNSLCIYAIKDDVYISKVDFDIFTDKDAKKYISPRYNPSHCDYFLLTGERLAMCRTLEISADEYVDRHCYNENFTFVLEESK